MLMTMKHHLVAIPRHYGILFHLLAGMCICILANYSNSSLDLLPIKFFLEEINRGVFNHFFDEEMKKVDEIVLSQIRNQSYNQNKNNQNQMKVVIKKCNDVSTYEISNCTNVYIGTGEVKSEKKSDTDRVAKPEDKLYAVIGGMQETAPDGLQETALGGLQEAAPDGLQEAAPGDMHQAAPIDEMSDAGNPPGKITMEIFAQAVDKLMEKKDEYGKPIMRYQKQWIGIFRVAADIGLVGNTDYEGFCNMMNKVRPEGYKKKLCKNDIKKISNSFCYFKPFKQWSFGLLMGNETERPFSEMQNVAATLLGILKIEL